MEDLKELAKSLPGHTLIMVPQLVAKRETANPERLTSMVVIFPLMVEIMPQVLEAPRGVLVAISQYMAESYMLMVVLMVMMVQVLEAVKTALPQT